ncbi:hypothetical protein EJ04DRAFT_62286 [Polyplosphaeria fusca]|uniref:Uncharacterized protein n=1 Tax=Polyplosphaeria fusca TaxID=682080 RepID=A0A9P4V514_9PLEO|nr:hypothetical protein EJ04DRAFT_62286 [Polyplosphaeria fusca]
MPCDCSINLYASTCSPDTCHPRRPQPGPSIPSLSRPPNATTFCTHTHSCQTKHGKAQNPMARSTKHTCMYCAAYPMVMIQSAQATATAEARTGCNFRYLRRGLKRPMEVLWWVFHGRRATFPWNEVFRLAGASKEGWVLDGSYGPVLWTRRIGWWFTCE